MNTLYEKLVSHFGSPSATAEALSVSPQVIDNWRSRGLPRGRALDIEQATRGAITARDILTARDRPQ